MTALSCRQIEGPLITGVQKLRYRVWKAEGVVLFDDPAGTIADPHDEHAIHSAAFDDQFLIGAAQLHTRQDDVPYSSLFAGVNLPILIASMNRLVVLHCHAAKR